jgi:mono/diheme cytochrome c family protein
MGDRIGRGRAPWRGRRLLVGGALVALIALGSGCGGGDDDNGSSASPQTNAATSTTRQANDKPAHSYAKERTLFKQHCGGCHTLADAGVYGTGAGSEANLDIIRPNRASTQNYVEHSFGKMPSFRHELSRPQRIALATYVAAADGCGIKSPTSCDPHEASEG